MSSILFTRTRVSRSSLALVAAVGITTSGLAIAAPAQAASTGIGTGRAVVHVDAPTATVTKQADGSYLLAMPQGTTGQWMGERKNASGKSIVRVGTLTGEKLAANWSNLKYTSAAPGALFWDETSGNHQAAAVKVSRPKTTSTGVTFTLTSKTELPATMSDVSINLERAPSHKSVRSSSAQQVNITSDLWWSAQNNSSYAAVRIYNSTNNNTCWSKSVNASGPLNASVGSNRCDDIAYSDGQNVGKSSAAGANIQAQKDKKTGDMYVSEVQMKLQLTPDGQSSYTYGGVVDF